MLESSILVNFLKQFKDESCIYIPNPGNAGDSIIGLGAISVFKKAGIRPRLCSGKINFDTSKKIIFYGGGGNLISQYSNARNTISNLLPESKKIIILPHTIDGNVDFLNNLPSKVSVFCREPASFEHVKKHFTKGEVFIDHDLAFHVNYSQFLNHNNKLSEHEIWIASLKDYLTEPIKFEEILRLIRKARAQARTIKNLQLNHEINAYRTDSEKTSRVIPPNNFDISLKLSLSATLPNLSKLSAKNFINFINRFQIIHTNRLHVAIVGAVLNKEVKLSANNYHKCHSIYEYSLKNNYPNVNWAP